MSSGKRSNEVWELEKRVSYACMEEHKVHITWTIPNFSSLLSENKDHLRSPKFILNDMKEYWFITLYPGNLNRSGKQVLSLYLCLHSDKQLYITFEFSLLDASYVNVNTKTCTKWINKTLGYSQFMLISDLLKQKQNLLPNDELTVSLMLQTTIKLEKGNSCESPNVDRMGNSLVNHLWKFFNDKKNGNVVLKVGSEHISTHKVVLMCRSPVFAAMLNQDATTPVEIEIEEVEIDVLSEMIRYLFTDEITYKSINFTTKLLAAADEYDILQLKDRCIKNLSENLSPDNVFEVLITAHKYHEDALRNKCMNLVKSENCCLGDWICKYNLNPDPLNIIKALLDEQSPESLTDLKTQCDCEEPSEDDSDLFVQDIKTKNDEDLGMKDKFSIPWYSCLIAILLMSIWSHWPFFQNFRDKDD